MSVSTRPRLLGLAVILAACAVAAVLTLQDIRLASSQTVTLIARRSEEAIPLDDPSASVWKRAAAVEVPLSAQNVVPPMAGGDAKVTARALHDGDRLYIRLEWRDDAQDTSTIGQTEFADAAAVQFPVVVGEQVPPFCMGDPNAPVNIWQWKASWQTAVDDGFVQIEEAFPNTVVDLYPFEDEDVFYPSRAAGNILARTDRTTPVDNLLAGSFGTLSEATDQMIEGRGEWDDGRWRVVFARDLEVTGEYTQFAVDGRTDLAFAVWDGDQGQRDGMKSVSRFLSLDISSEIAKESGGPPAIVIGMAIVAGLAALLLLALGYLAYYRRRGA